MLKCSDLQDLSGDQLLAAIQEMENAQGMSFCLEILLLHCMCGNL
jgi:hypothetical protein